MDFEVPDAISAQTEQSRGEVREDHGETFEGRDETKAGKQLKFHFIATVAFARSRTIASFSFPLFPPREGCDQVSPWKQLPTPQQPEFTVSPKCMGTWDNRRKRGIKLRGGSLDWTLTDWARLWRCVSSAGDDLNL